MRMSNSLLSNSLQLIQSGIAFKKAEVIKGMQPPKIIGIGVARKITHIDMAKNFKPTSFLIDT